jgi:hypothetical protein
VSGISISIVWWPVRENSPKIRGNVNHEGHVHTSFWTSRTNETQKTGWPIRVRAVSFARERLIETVRIPASQHDVEILVESCDD